MSELKCLTDSCEDCPIAKIEDPQRRAKAALYAGEVLRDHQRKELRAAHENGSLDRLIYASTDSYDEELRDWVGAPDIDYYLVEETVLRIAQEECPKQIEGSLILGRRNDGKDF